MLSALLRAAFYYADKKQLTAIYSQAVSLIILTYFRIVKSILADSITEYHNIFSGSGFVTTNVL